MKENRYNNLSGEKLEEAVLREKELGTPDLEIGEKYGVTYRYIEKVVTKNKGINVSEIKNRNKIKSLFPKNFRLKTSSVWSFKQRGDWATHNGTYRGNYSPYIPRNIILRYSEPGETVLDCFCGGGTTAIEAKLLGRKCLACDINEEAIALAEKNLDFEISTLPFPDNEIKEFFEPELRIGDARDLSWLDSNSIDLICTHPPYANIIQYTDNKKGDLSFLDVEEFLQEMAEVAAENFRVLKPGRQCAVLIGDMRRKKHVIPLAFKLINVYLAAGFRLRELIIKRQHNCKTTGFWYESSIKNNFLLLAHEYLPMFEKPEKSQAGKTLKVQEEAPGLAIGREKLESTIKINQLETTTVWLFPKDKKEELTDKNIIKRYSSGSNFEIVKIERSDKKNNGIKLRAKEDLELVWVKSPVLNLDDGKGVNPQDYLERLQSLSYEIQPSLRSGGYLAIETRDLRKGEQLIPAAKLIVDLLQDETLWLKEIIVVAEADDQNNFQRAFKQEFLDIVHSYILVYEKK
ncbi:MAG: methyltransferase domain-containing protein [Candidatus Saccharicenans sp.]|jgi:DNA modification methylase|nr:methyltransferase domain-containing protein [Candidatus Saccharicenans sp.]